MPTELVSRRLRQHQAALESHVMGSSELTNVETEFVGR